MTPGNGRRRDEVPWLHYEGQNSVRVINSHFGSSKLDSVADSVAGYHAPKDTGAAATDQFGVNDGELVNGASRESVDGKLAYAFDGINDHIRIGNVLNPVFVGASAKFSIAAWISLTAAGSCAVVSKIGDGNHSENQRQFLFFTANGELRFIWYGALIGEQRTVFSGTNLIDAGMVHVGVSFDATIANSQNKAELYVNGVKSPRTVTGLTADAAIQTGAARLAIGAGIGTSSSVVAYPFNGKIDDVLISPRLLTTDEWAALASKRGKAY